MVVVSILIGSSTCVRQATYYYYISLFTIGEKKKKKKGLTTEQFWTRLIIKARCT